jgi:isopentenyl diphosphate isomerase/L-lactate dehydrogenase-like FMN-dependent dehydrogenase
VTRLDSVPCIEDLRLLAKRRLPRVCFDFIDGGAEGEATLGANARAFADYYFRPNHLTGIAERDLGTVVCGDEVSLPVLLAPVGLTRVASKNAEVEAARAAGRAGTVYCFSSMASTKIEEIAGAATGPLWFQLYLWRQADVAAALARRAHECGIGTLVVTVDTPVSSKRERDWRNGFTVPLRLSLADRLEVLRHPRWLWGYVSGPPLTLANLAEAGRGSKAEVLGKWVNTELCNPAQSYDDLRRLRESWPGQLLVKGTLTRGDAELAVACGVDGVIVSNHGGRQLDFAEPAIDVLPEIAAAVGGKVEILLDSGVRRGSDVVKAIALGAKAVLIGRPYLWGLAVAGQAGVERVLEIFRTEIDLCLTLTGRGSIRDLDASLVAPRRAKD